MSFQLSAEQEELRRTVRQLAQELVAPRAAEVDATAEFPWDIKDAFAQYDILALPVPAEYGGVGADHLTICVAIEEIARCCATSSLILAVQELGSLPITLFGTPEQKQQFLPRVASGEWLAAFALSEAGAGSDVAALSSRAVRDGDHYVLNGTKRFITHGGIAGVYTVFASTDPSASHHGITAFVMEADTPGFECVRVEPKMGIRGSPTGELAFTDVRIPVANRLGAEGEGFKVAMQTLDRTRLGIGAQALGIAQGALDYAAKYSTERIAFGKPLAELDVIQYLLADLAIKVEAARSLLYRAAALADAGSPQLSYYSAMAKCFCADTAMQVTTDAVQVLGGYGYISEFPVERMMRDAKITQIYEGTNQIQRLVVGRALTGGKYR